MELEMIRDGWGRADKVYHDTHNMFSGKKANVLAQHQPYDLKIDLEEGAKPFHRPIYSLLPSELTIVCRIMVPSINRLWSPVWRLSTCLESGIIYNIPFNMQNLSKIPLKSKLGNSKVPQTTS